MGRIVTILILTLCALVAATLWRASARSMAALRDFPPTGSFVTVDGGAVHFRQAGSGPDLVLIHGASGNIRDFDFGLFDALSGSFRVTAFDRPGMGHSDPISDPGLAAQVNVIKTAAAQLGITKPLIVGQSYGGSIALEWALQGGPAGLVLISSPSMPWPGELDIWYRLNNSGPGALIAPALAAAHTPRSYVEAAITAIFAPDPVPPIYQDQIGSGLTLRAASLRANAAQINALRAELVARESLYAALDLPVEMIHGDADTIVPLSIHSGPLSQILPNARLAVLPGVGHMPHHVRLPEVLAAINRAASRAGLQPADQSP